MRPLAALLAGAAIPEGTPVAIARVGRDGAIEHAVAGQWAGGIAVAATDRFYAASLSKQVTGAAIALLVRSGVLEAGAPVSEILDGLPHWASAITVRHLLHHTSGIAGAGEVPDGQLVNRTDDFVLAAIRGVGAPKSAPGVEYAYSNGGYTLLAQIVRAVSGQPLAVFAGEYLFRPLGLDGAGFAGPGLNAFPQNLALGPVKPLSHGDGGIWTTARAFAGWLHAQNEDRFAIAPLVTAPGRLGDGSPVDYGWGIGLRSHRNRQLYIHGGSWPGAWARAARSPHHCVAVAGFSSGGDRAGLDAIVSAALDDATT